MMPVGNWYTVPSATQVMNTVTELHLPTQERNLVGEVWCPAQPLSPCLLHTAPHLPHLLLMFTEHLLCATPAWCQHCSLHNLTPCLLVLGGWAYHLLSDTADGQRCGASVSL